MKTSSEGFQQCYNAQAAVDAEHQLVVATEVTANASDQGGAAGAARRRSQETFDTQPETVLADAGYSNERDLADLENARHRRVCVAWAGRGSRRPGPAIRRSIPRPSRMAEKLSTSAGRAAYAERKWLSEAPVRLDQARAGIPALQPAGAGKGAGRVGLGVPGVERQAPASC